MSENQNIEVMVAAANLVASTTEGSQGINQALEATEQAYNRMMGIAFRSSDDGVQSAIPIDQSVTDEYIVCLEDGKRLKMLKRYLMTNYNMTPEEYRKRWKLPANYPMVAPNYSETRSKLAKDIGLGKNVEDV